MGFTKKLSVAAGWNNLGTLMKTAGWTRGNIVSSIGIFSPNADLLYIHLTQTRTASPATGADGWPIGTDAAAVDKTFFADRGANQASLDIGTTWLFNAGGAPINIKVIAVGT